jgi:hypothetical protein
MAQELRTEARDARAESCNVSSTFNFTVGALSLAAAIVIGYGVWHWLR